MCSAGEIEDGEDVGDGKDVGDVGDGEGDVGDGEDIFVCVFLFPKTQHYHIHCFIFFLKHHVYLKVYCRRSEHDCNVKLRPASLHAEWVLLVCLGGLFPVVPLCGTSLFDIFYYIYVYILFYHYYEY